MKLLLVTYDLNDPGQKYKAVHEAIKSLGSWWHFLESTWLVATNETPDQVSNRLRTAGVDGNDRLLVVDITNDSYQGWLPKEAWDWIRTHITGAMSR